MLMHIQHLQFHKVYKCQESKNVLYVVLSKFIRLKEHFTHFNINLY